MKFWAQKNHAGQVDDRRNYARKIDDGWGPVRKTGGPAVATSEVGDEGKVNDGWGSTEGRWGIPSLPIRSWKMDMMKIEDEHEE